MGLSLEDDSMCYVCGKNNPQGLKLDFSHPQKGILRTMVVFSKEHQGYKNIVHGGMISMLLDEMMVNLAWKEGLPAVTAELTVRLKKPTLIGEKVFFEGRLDRETEKVLYTSADAKNEAGDLLASATGTCVRIAEIRQNP